MSFRGSLKEFLRAGFGDIVVCLRASGHGCSIGDHPPANILTAASFAESLANSYIAHDGSIRDLFTAFVGIVAAQDAKLAAVSLSALENVLLQRASALTP